MAKYIVGIDLGTTNSALACCDATAAEGKNQIEVRSIPQLVDPNEVAERTLLPSFLYIPGEFGIRIEDMVLVTERSGETLTPATKALVEL